MYQNPHDPDNKVITQKVKEWIIEKFNPNSNLQIEIIEIGCLDDNCPCVQTHIKVVSDTEKNFLIGKPLYLIRKWDINNLIITKNAFNLELN
jgi:hypothetical protein